MYTGNGTLFRQETLGDTSLRVQVTYITERQRDRETETETERESKRQTDRQTDRQTGRDNERERQRQREKMVGILDTHT